MRSLIPWRRSTESDWRPFQELETWHRDIDDLFSRFFGAEPEAFGGTAPLESFVRNGDLIVRADLPGVDPKEVDINLMGNVLTIKGERKSKEEKKNEDYIRHEISYGSFERRMTVPEGIDADKIKAKYENGVLELTMPVPKTLAPKKVPIQVEAKRG